MARPSKNNADFFGHDHDMRNHRKIKAIRAKFGITGYAIWVMFLEVLTESDENRFVDNELEIELLAGDFGVSVTEIRELLNYCIRLELLYSESGRIYSKTLDDKLKSVYEKRDLARKNYEKRLDNKTNSTSTSVSVTEMTQSKGKEKVKEEDTKVSVDPPTNSKPESKSSFKAPTIEEVSEYFSIKNNCSQRAALIFAEKFTAHYQSNGWMVGKSKMKDWKAAVNGTWKDSGEEIIKKANNINGHNPELHPNSPLQKKIIV